MQTYNIRGWQLFWIFALCLNLIVPVLLALNITKEHGRAGMMAGIFVLWVAGHFACGKNRKLTYSLVTGSFVFALSQFYPVAHLVTGILSLSFVKLIGLSGQNPNDVGQFNDGIGEINSELGGFIATLMTGTPLVAVALVIGLGFYAAFGQTKKPIADMKDL